MHVPPPWWFVLTLEVGNQDILALTAASAPGLQVVCLFPLESVKDGRPCLKLKHEKCRRDRIQSVGAEEVWWGSDKFKKWRCDCDKENSSENRLIVWCVNKDDVESILRVDEV